MVVPGTRSSATVLCLRVDVCHRERSHAFAGSCQHSGTLNNQVAVDPLYLDTRDELCQAT